MEQFYDLAKIVAPIVIAAIGFGLLWWLQRWFPTRKELDGLGARVTKISKENAATKALADDNRDRLALIEQAQEHQRERIQDTVVKPLELITTRLESIASKQEDQGVAITRIDEGFKGVKVSLDDLKRRFEAGAR